MNNTLPPPDGSVPERDGYARPAYAEPLEEEGGGIDVRRLLNVAFRYKWLIFAFLLLGGVAAWGVWRFVGPDYAAQGSIWVEASERGAGATGPIRSGQLLNSSAWIELLRSFAVVDSVAIREQLYVRPEDPALRSAFDDFRIADGFRPGEYTVQVSEDGRYSLRTAEGLTVQQGQMGDSIGRDVGLLWAPDPGELPEGDPVGFTILHPRDASRQLLSALDTRMDQSGNFLRVELLGADPERTADILNAVMERFIDVATVLKRERIDAFLEVLGEQRASVQEELAEAEAQLENYRVSTITLPSDQAAIAPGLQMTQDPVFSQFFQMRVEQEQLRRDRASLASLLGQIEAGEVRPEAFEVVPAVQSSPELVGALGDLTRQRAELRALGTRYTDQYQPVRELQRGIATLETETIPQLTRNLISELDGRIERIETRLSSTSEDLRQIPTRSIEEARLNRQVTATENLFRDLDQRYEQARLEAASSIPDVRILDRAEPPQVPANDQRMRLAGVVLLGGLGLGFLVAFLLDRGDPRMRYPEQIEDDLGLPILGAVPRIVRGRGRKAEENRAQLLEAFREIRLNVSYAYGAAASPLILTVTSPAQGEGKSLVSSNLALAFAELGYRTILVDGDTRRGDVNELLNVERKPGLIDLLAARAEGHNGSGPRVVRSTENPNLQVIPSGSRLPNAPELLASNAMGQLLSEMKERYRVIILDSPPLGAGGDAFLLSALTGHMLLVVRSGATNQDLLEARMESLRRLPVRVLGAVLNDISAGGEYRYHYGYIPGYEAGSEAGEEPRLVGAGAEPDEPREG